MFERVKTFLGISAASQLPPVETPKVKGGAQAYPSYLKTSRQSSAILPRDDQVLINRDLTTYRNTSDTRTMMRNFAASSPDMSAAVFAYLRTAITDGYMVVARNLDGSANPEATALCQQLCSRMDVLTDYTDGFSGTLSMRSTSESLAKELVLYGSCAAELVLDKTRLPKKIQPISTTNVQFIADAKNRILQPVQKLGAETVDLDIPTFFYTALDQDLLQPYSVSPLEPVLKPALFSEDFMQDLHRVLKRHVHPRTVVTINEEKFRENLPSMAQESDEAMSAYQASILAEIESKLNGLAPEDSLVIFDTLTIDKDNNGNISLASEYETLQSIANARMATGAKVMPSILGHEVGSSNVASTSSLLFMKNANVIRQKLNELYSRIFTLAVRLFGHDVYVTFEYAPIDLRPESELEAFKQTKQTRTLELLSFGFITDEEASLALTGHLPPKGFKPLSGTMFKAGAAGGTGGANMPVDQNANPSNGGSTLNQKLAPDTPPQGRGQNKKAEGDETPIQAVTPDITINVDVDANKREDVAQVIRMKRDEDGNLVVERMQREPERMTSKGLQRVG